MVPHPERDMASDVPAERLDGQPIRADRLARQGLLDEVAKDRAVVDLADGTRLPRRAGPEDDQSLDRILGKKRPELGQKTVGVDAQVAVAPTWPASQMRKRDWAGNRSPASRKTAKNFSRGIADGWLPGSVASPITPASSRSRHGALVVHDARGRDVEHHRSVAGLDQVVAQHVGERFRKPTR